MTHRMNHRTLVISVATFGLTLAMGIHARAAAISVSIFDLTDTVTATINGVPVTPLPDSTGEFLHFNVPLTA